MTPDQIATKADIEELRRHIEALMEPLQGAQIIPRPEWVPVPEYARQVGRSPATVRRWIADGKIEARGSGGARMVKV